MTLTITSDGVPVGGVHVFFQNADSTTFDAASHTAAVTEDTTGQMPDFTFIELGVFRQADSRSWDWTLAAPHATTIAFPTLPTDVYDFNVNATDQAFFDRWTNAKVPGGYDAVRALILNPWQPADLAVTTSGQASLEDALVGFRARAVRRRL